MSTKPVAVNPRAPLRHREIIFGQTPCVSPLPRSPSPSRLAPVPVRRREARYPCACLSVAAKPVSVYLLVPFSRRKVLTLFPIGFMQPQWSHCRVRCTTPEIATGECARATRTGRSCPATRWGSYIAEATVVIHRGDGGFLLLVVCFVSCSRLLLD